jgi:2-dehydro-3-deoxyphosphogluconate aldolase/(4S)-4-hydroxy-2-oxoglutarate aldolase
MGVRFMTKTNDIDRTRDQVLAHGLILSVRLGPDAPVLAACRAAIRGGISVVEVALTTPGALETIGTLAREGKALIGGGTILTTDDVRAVHAAGGKFASSLVFDPEVVAEAQRVGLLPLPGAGTPTEIIAAYQQGARLVRVFPVGALGGPAFIRAMRRPFPDVALIATGGPTTDNFWEYFAAGAAAVGVSAEVVPTSFTEEVVEEAARRVRRAADRARHVSI